MILPTEKVKKSISGNPKFTVIFGKPKSGKTTLVSFLDNCLVVDFENGSNFVEVASVTINKSSELKQLREALQAKDAPKYKYIVLDTATAMEGKLLPAAKALYKATPMGKDYKGDILSLPNGLGYYYLREAVSRTLASFMPLAEHIILLGHTKAKNIDKEGEELNEYSLDLSGKLADIVCADADAVGFLFRRGNKTILNFQGGLDFIVEARPDHLRGKEIVMMESDKNGHIEKANWDKIFISK